MKKTPYTFENGEYPDLTPAQVKLLEKANLIYVENFDCYLRAGVEYVQVELFLKGTK